ncbi:MAG: hypothetical protein LBD01_05425 [Puniceicoccales bacterium]|jgi:Rad3-related DNA helicase|nr:hypothetical protein [Puniceicoccales bacterium]
MRFVPGQRCLEIAAGEFANFGTFTPARIHAGGRWRAELGQEWHEHLRARTSAGESHVTWRFEQTIRTVLVQDKWTFLIDGRMDQVRSGEIPEIIEVREVKTVQESLPRPAAYWRETRPTFFVQLALYCLGMAQARENIGRTICGILVLAEPATGIVQEVPLDEAPLACLRPVAEQLALFAEDRWTSRLRLEHLRIAKPFSGMRQEWEDAQKRLAETSGKILLLEAPTGFGKTALALGDALRRLRDGEVSRIIYTTGKNSGRLQVLRELDRFVEPGTLRSMTLHAKEEHALDGPPQDAETWQENWRRHGISPSQLFATGKTSLDDVRALGVATGVPPWEITRALLPLSEFLLCDYNYIFAPRQAGTLANLSGWNESTTLLIVDEAHNLPGRAALARTLNATHHGAHDALEALLAAGAPKEWLRHWEAWVDFLEQQAPAETLRLNAQYLLRDLCEEIRNLWEQTPPFWLELPAPVMEELEIPIQMATTDIPLDKDSPERFHWWAPRAGCIRAECLEAAAEIAATLLPFGRAVLMSATLAPRDSFELACNLRPNETDWFSCEVPWRKNAYTVIVDARVDTRLKTRERHLRTTAETVLAMATTGPLAVFFPSYRYAETVCAYAAALEPGLRIAVQKPGATPTESDLFIQEALLSAHALFLVMGGVLAEGIDLLGGHLQQALIVSPGLPEMSPAQTARMAQLERTGATNAFHRIYIVPAMRKVNQALGRIVRAPGQHARVVLHCRRFADPNYASLLAPEYQNNIIVHNEQQWQQVLHDSMS